MAANTLPQGSPSRSREDYTIGWISALAIESAAAAEMLDTEHEPLPIAAEDSNDYVLGRIGQHNVVMACINEAGGLPANNVATYLVKSFHNVRYVLMVGIGGGIPSEKHHIRLGDIVVCEPSGTSGGVVQSDFGKWETDGFKPMGHLNRPAEGLIRGIGAMKRQQIRNKSKIHSFVKHFPGSLSDPEAWKYQGRENDPIYAEDLELRQEGVCPECKAQPTPHAPDPKVHYGIIASGNQVIKNREQRDKLRDQLGACCVEMEAFGLMNNFPCLVIRGISDYADGRKNDKWQPYAALTAAAYAKELLLQLPSVQVEDTPKMSKQLEKLENKIDVMGEKLDASRHRQHNKALFKWLSPLEPWKRHQDIRKAYKVPDTSTALLDEFLKWRLNASGGFALCALGDPGAGKTVATSVLVEDLMDHTDPLKTGVACVYLDFKDQSQQTTENIIGAIIKQLLRPLPKIPERIEEIWRKYQYQTAPIEQTTEMLCEACNAFTETYICIDALDECKDLKELLDRLTQAHSKVTSIRLICTGRPHIRSIINSRISVPKPSMISVKARGSDVRAFAAWRIEDDRKENPRIMDDALKEKIIEKLLEAFDGVFLLPVLHIGLILEEDTIASRKDRLNSLQPSVKQTFTETMKRIEDSKRSKINAVNILTWIHLAERPLTVDELLHALAVKEEKEDLDRENFKDPDTFLSCCLGLATIDTETSTVRLVHALLHEYFTECRQIFEQTIQQGHDYIARTCLRYIMFRPLTADLLPQTGQESPASEAQIRSRYLLLDYASCQWGHHLRKSEQREESPVVELAQSYLSMDPQKRYWSQLRLCEHIDRNPYITSVSAVASFSKLQMAAYFGIHSVLSGIKLEATELNPKNSTYERSPLSWAAWKGHETVVDLLLKNGAQPDSKDGDGQTPLTWAIEGGNAEVIQLLLDKGVKVDYWYTRIRRAYDGFFGEEFERTPLSRAAEKGNERAVKLLLENFAQPDSKSKYEQTPLTWAIEGGNTEVIRLLLNMGVKVNYWYRIGGGYIAEEWDQIDWEKRTPLSRAAEKGNQIAVKLLLENGAQPDSKGEYGHTPLTWAIEGGNTEVIRLLLNKGVKVDYWYTVLAWDLLDDDDFDDEGHLFGDGRVERTPLLRVAEKGDKIAVELLLKNGAQPDSKNNDGETALSLAARQKHVAVVKLLESYLDGGTQDVSPSQESGGK